jgi:hypothetical protein
MDLPTLELYAWGCVGGGIAAIIVHVLPEVVHTARTGKLKAGITPLRVGAILLLVLLLAAIAGVGPLFPAHVTRPGVAIGYGVGAQATLKALISGAQEALRP